MPDFLGNDFPQDRLPDLRLLHHGLFYRVLFDCERLRGNRLGCFVRHCGWSALTFTRRAPLSITRLAGWRTVGLFATRMLVRIVLMLGVPVTAATAAATAATFFARAFRRTIARLALFDCGKGLLLILPRPWPP